jgi:hypothetical protein
LIRFSLQEMSDVEYMRARIDEREDVVYNLSSWASASDISVRVLEHLGIYMGPKISGGLT